MLSVHGGSVTVCCMQLCPVANCSIVEHQRRRRLGHQQLLTATGEHPAGVSVRTADIVLTTCRTNVASLQLGMIEPCSSASERRSSPAWTAHARTLATSGNWRVCWWCGPSAADRRWIVRQRWVPTGDGCTGSLVSLPAQDCRSPVGTWRERRQASGRQTSAPNVGYCAADAERQSSWQRFSERGITCWDQSRSEFRDLGLTSTGWGRRTRFEELTWAADDNDELSHTKAGRSYRRSADGWPASTRRRRRHTQTSAPGSLRQQMVCTSRIPGCHWRTDVAGSHGSLLDRLNQHLAVYKINLSNNVQIFTLHQNDLCTPFVYKFHQNLFSD